MPTLLANMVVPLLHFACCGLVLLNLIIACIEGSALARFCRAPRGPAIQTMIFANFLSSIIGFVILAPLAGLFVDGTEPPLYTAPWFLIAVLCISLVGSFVVETPFALAIGRRGRAPVRRTLAVFGSIQLATHAAAAGLLLFMSTFTLYTELSLERNLRFVPQDLRAWVYFIDANDGTIRRIPVSGGEIETIECDPVQPCERWGLGTRRLFTRRSEHGGFDLWIDESPARPLLEGFAQRAGMWDEGNTGEGWRPDWKAADLRDEEDRDWMIWRGYFDVGGFVVRQYEPGFTHFSQGRRLWSAAFRHPWGPQWGWPTDSITILPGGIAVMSLDRDQIIVADIEHRKIAHLTRGRSPVVTLEEP